jgi:hypothetical protein
VVVVVQLVITELILLVVAVQVAAELEQRLQVLLVLMAQLTQAVVGEVVVITEVLGLCLELVVLEL